MLLKIFKSKKKLLLKKRKGETIKKVVWDRIKQLPDDRIPDYDEIFDDPERMETDLPNATIGRENPVAPIVREFPVVNEDYDDGEMDAFIDKFSKMKIKDRHGSAISRRVIAKC